MGKKARLISSHISADEHAAVGAAAVRCGMSVSAFVTEVVLKEAARLNGVQKFGAGRNEPRGPKFSRVQVRLRYSDESAVMSAMKKLGYESLTGFCKQAGLAAAKSGFVCSASRGDERLLPRVGRRGRSRLANPSDWAFPVGFEPPELTIVRSAADGSGVGVGRFVAAAVLAVCDGGLRLDNRAVGDV